MHKKTLNRTLTFSIIIFVFIVGLSIVYMEKDNDFKYSELLPEEKGNVYVFNNSDLLCQVSVNVNNDNVIKKATSLIETLIIGNDKNVSLPDDFYPVLPSDTKILDIKIVNDILQVTFNKDLLNKLDEKMVESLTYTLTDLKDVLGVEIYINNKLLTYIPTSLKEIPAILTKDFGINKEYNITNTSNVQKIILYYVFNNDDVNYYVPITKYTNDKREKIEIIIDELSSKSASNTNLMSFLNSNVRLISYEMKDNIFELTFNELFFNSVNIDLEEEVLYTISNSIFNSYDVSGIELRTSDNKYQEKIVKNS